MCSEIGTLWLTISFDNVELDASIVRKVPFPVISRRVLTGEAGASQCVNVQGAVETRTFFLAIEIRLEADSLIVALCGRPGD